MFERSRRRLLAVTLTLAVGVTGILGLVLAPNASAATTTRGTNAVNFAFSELGHPYVYGAAGPYYFDCSGLTQYTYAHVGVGLPRTAADQYAWGYSNAKMVPRTQAKPGDLVFWGSNTSNWQSVYHVAIYVGFGAVESAPSPGEVIRIQPVWTQDLMPYVVRP